METKLSAKRQEIRVELEAGGRTIAAGTGDEMDWIRGVARVAAEAAESVAGIHASAYALPSGAQATAQAVYDPKGIALTIGIPAGAAVYPTTAQALEAMSQEQQAALYAQGYRAIVATYNETVTMHALAEDGSLAWIGCNKDVAKLLDNPDFSVAQAGYGGKHGTQVYAADRWGIYSADAEYSIQGKAKEIVLSVTSGAITIFQRVQKLPAGSYTCGFYTPYGPSFVELNTTSPDSDLVEFAVGAGNSVTLNGAFLYEGSYTAKTLPPWVAPDPVAELIKCRNFFRTLTAYSIIGVAIVDSASSVLGVVFGDNMRIDNPSLVGEINFWNGASVINVTSVTQFLFTGNGFRFTATTSGGVSVGEVGFLIPAPNSAAISADL